VLAVTLGLFTWVMVLAEQHPLRDYGFRIPAAGRFLVALLMGLGAVAVYAMRPYAALFEGHVRVTADSLVFALLFSSLGSALPEELLFRGFLQGSLAHRARRWARVMLPALAFTMVRSARYLPGTHGLGVSDWLFYVFGVVFPLGLWWGLMRDLSGGSIWPGLISHFLLEYGTTLASASPSAHVG